MATTGAVAGPRAPSSVARSAVAAQEAVVSETVARTTLVARPTAEDTEGAAADPRTRTAGEWETAVVTVTVAVQPLRPDTRGSIKRPSRRGDFERVCACLTECNATVTSMRSCRCSAV